MNRVGLALAGARHRWRSALALCGGALVGSAVLVGALGVGDSVRATLADRARARTGRAEHVLGGGDRFFETALAARLVEESGGRVHAAPLVALRAVASTPDGSARRSGVGVHGVDGRFFALAPAAPPAEMAPAPGEALVGRPLAERLGLAPGAALVLRVPRPSALSRDLALAQTEDAVLALSLEVAGVIDAGSFGEFSLHGGARAESVFVDLAWLAERIERPGAANVLLAAGTDGAPLDPAELDAALARAFRLADAELSWRSDERGFVELTSRRILLEAPLARAVERAGEPALGVLTYFVNAIEADGRATPYSTIAALGPIGDARALAGGPLDLAGAIPPDLAPDEIVLTDWLAADLGVGEGARVELAFFAPSAERRLVERRAALRVRAVAPLAPPLADPTLMPDFPGIAESEHCRDWEPGIPIDLDRIRDVDEEWWEERRGTPKAFLSLAGGRELFASRFGELTAVRYPTERAGAARGALARALGPGDAGLFFQPLASASRASGRSATDFGGLFLGLSSFLVAAAALLAGLGFAFAVEARAREIGTLRALGFRPRAIGALLLGEGAPLALAGALLGAPLGVAYAWALLQGLRTIWSGAVGGAALRFAVAPSSIAIGVGGALAVSLAAIAWASRKLVTRPAVELLASRAGFLEREARALERGGRKSRVVAVFGVAFAAILLMSARGESGPALAGRHFAAGFALLVAAIAASRALLARRVRPAAPERLSLALLGVRNAARRPGRSSAILALLAGVLFLVATLTVHQRGKPDARAPGSGTGGYELLARSAIPLHHDLDTPEGRAETGLAESDARGVHVLELAVHGGDDASCLELAAPERPALLGVDPRALAERGAFTFVQHEGESGASPWLLLAAERGDGALAAVGDHAMLAWQLHVAVGDELRYVDERGEPFRVRIVGALADSVLQGSLVVARDALLERYPSTSGAERFLIDVEGRDAAEVAAVLTRALADRGFEAELAATRLGELLAVQDTYLEVFQMLSGLGLLVGSLGLGLVVLRNGLERRGEYALLAAVGHGRGALFTMLASEHAWLFAAGAISGAVAALATILPTFVEEGRALPAGPVLVAIAATLALGAAAIGGASAWSTRAVSIASLRDEE